MNVKRQSANPSHPSPIRATEGAGGYDLHADIEEEVIILHGKTAMIPTGWAWEIPAGYVGVLVPRSGKASREGMVLANTVGIVDQDFRGAVVAAVTNRHREPLCITPGERFCQMVVVPCLQDELTVVESLSETERGGGGFGSTGE